MRIALRGVWPTQVFEDELFDPKSLRGQMAGKELALGWRLCKSLKKLFGCNTAWSCYKTFANATLNEHVVSSSPSRAAYFLFRADHKARIEANFFERNYMCNFICECCAARRPNQSGDDSMNYQNFRPDCPRYLTRISHYAAAHMT